MEYRKIGKTGLKVSALSLGSWLTFGNQITDDTAKQLMYTAYDHGINFFDNAEGYAEKVDSMVISSIHQLLMTMESTFLTMPKVMPKESLK